MRYLFLIVMLLNVTLAFAQEVKVEINPPKPVAGEVFQAMFRIFTDADNEPSINFSPSGLEVVGKTNQGVSTRTIYENGKLTVTREIMVVYELAASKPGNASLNNITVQVGAKTLRHPSINISVLKEAEVMGDVFVMADIPKKTVFLGEGIIARYYLYTKFQVNNLDVKKYPKLNNFLKRFLQEPDRTERVSVNGQLYLRSQIYAAKLFPEKVGELKIDPLSLSVTYPVTRGNDPFGSFGLSRELKTRTFNTETIPIQVKPLPEPVPSHFTGLVGRHDFDLEFNQNKLIVNEPLNIKLTVTGNGALENLEAPTILKNPALEEFESNGELKITDANTATKIFDYTFLAKQNLNIPAAKHVLSYFDPDTGRYVATELNIPALTIAGGSAKVDVVEDKIEDSPKTENKDNKTPPQRKKSFDFSNPILVDGTQLRQFLPYFNYSLALVAILLAGFWFLKSNNLPTFNRQVDIPQPFKKGQYSFGEFAKWMAPLISKTGKSPLILIRESDLDQNSKEYFIQLLTSMDLKDYSSGKPTSAFKYEPTHFRKLGHYIASVKNEDSSQPS